MKENKVFCEFCRDEVRYTTEQKIVEGKIKGEIYPYMAEVSRCAVCGKEVDVWEERDKNLKALYHVFREKNDIVSLETVRGIADKYQIGKRPLSLLLGWGETTYARFYDGDIPSKQYSDTLQRISHDAKYYLEILEKNKDCLKSKDSYLKSKKAAEKLLVKSVDITSKINLVIEYLCNKCGDITPLSLQKALYYVQGFSYAFYEHFIFEENCEAWVHGPVFREIYNKYKEYQYANISEESDFDSTVFTAKEKVLLDSVIKNICCYSGKVLEHFTHNETPWIKARGSLLEGQSSDEIISKKDIGEYFTTVKEKYNMVNPTDIQSYIKDMYLQV